MGASAASLDEAPAETASLEEARTDTSARRWLGRGGVLGGGAVSLAIGAVLGGVLEGVPHLLAPPVTAGAFPVTSTGDGSGHVSAQLAASRSASPDWRSLLNGILPVASVGVPFPGAVHAPAPSTSSPTGGPVPGGAPVGGGGGVAPSGGAVGAGPVSGDGNSSPTGPPPCDASCALVNSVTQTVSQVPGAGEPLSGVVAQAGGVASGAASGAASGVAGLAPSAPGSTGSTVPSGSVTNVTSTAIGTLFGPGGPLGF